MNQTKRKSFAGSVLICSVGGSIDPLIQSINEHQPAYLIYVVSRDTREKIREIEQQLVWRGIKDSHIITLSDYQDLLACVRDIREGVQTYLQIKRMSCDTLLLADITGGTKVMSSALTLVMMEYRSRFSYVGGTERTKDGTGIVLSGYEKIMRLDNPWEVMALKEVQNLVQAFNTGQFCTAFGIADFLAGREMENSKFYGGIKDIVDAYWRWDAFDHATAQNLLQRGIGRLQPYSNYKQPKFQEQLNLFLESQKILEKVLADAKVLRSSKIVLPLSRDCGRYYLQDLLANAQRRAALGRYDDAVARIYSAIEKTAKIALAWYGKNNSHLTADDLQTVSEDFRQQFAGELEQNGFVQTGLQNSFRYLCELDSQEPIAQAYLKYEEKLKQALQVRNMSLLAHGYAPVAQKNFDDLFAIALDFLRVEQSELPQFPILDVQSLLL